ncbi:MAG TPA: glycosyltransferase family 39 protein [Bryobacteraceae bacterium]
MSVALLVFFLCAYLRFVNLDWGIGPKVRAGWHPDEQIVVGLNGSLAANRFDTDMKRAPLAEGLQGARYNFSSYFYAAYFWYNIVEPMERALHSKQRPGPLQPVVIYRQFSALLGLAACIFVYCCARMFIPEGFALLAALFTGVCPLLVQDSHYARAESFVTAAAAGILWLTILIANAPRRILYFCTGLLIGVVTACKISIGPLLFLPVAAIGARFWPHLQTEKRRALQYLGITTAGFVLGIISGVPYGVVHWRDYWHGWQYLRSQYSNPFPPHGPDPPGYCFGFIGNYFASTFGIALFILAGLGVFHLIRARRYFLMVILVGPVLLYYVIFGFEYAFFERNISHIVPCVTLLAAVGCLEIWRQIQRATRAPQLRAAVLTIVIAAAIWVPLTLSWRIAVVVLSGRSYDPISEYDALLGDVYKGLPPVQYDGWSHQFLERIRQYLAAHPAGFILKVGDANDDLSRHRLAIARHIYNMKLLATVPGHFADLPTCTLQMYHSQTYSWYLVRPNGT